MRIPFNNKGMTISNDGNYSYILCHKEREQRPLPNPGTVAMFLNGPFSVFSERNYKRKFTPMHLFEGIFESLQMYR
jgi:hypothetical protein